MTDADVLDAPLSVAFEVPAADLLIALSGATFAMSRDRSRPSLRGMHVVVDADMLTVEAADGHVAARRILTLPAPATRKHDLIVPREAVDEIVRLLRGAIGFVHLLASDALLEVTIDRPMGRTQFTVAVPDVTFPDYITALVAQSRPAMVSVAGLDLSVAIEAVTQGSNAPKNALAVEAALTEGGLTIAHSNDGSERKQDIRAMTCLDGRECVEFKFRADQMLSVLKVSGGVARIHLGESRTPLLIECPHAGAVYLLAAVI